MEIFKCIKAEDLQNVNGGGLAGAFVGAIFGTAAGAIAGCVTVIVTGNAEDGGHIIWQVTKKGMTGGALAGLASPM